MGIYSNEIFAILMSTHISLQDYVGGNLEVVYRLILVYVVNHAYCIMLSKIRVSRWCVYHEPMYVKHPCHFPMVCVLKGNI